MAQSARVRQFYKEAIKDIESNFLDYELGDHFVHEFCKVFGNHGTPEC